MSMMKCDGCGELVDTDEYPDSLYAEEEGIKLDNSKIPDCICSSCWENWQQMYDNRRSGK